MRSLLRLAAGLAAAYFTARALAAAPFWQSVVLTFLAAGLAAAIVREFFSAPPRPLADLLPDIAAPLVLAVIMLLAIRAFGAALRPSPVAPALVWPFVDLWRPIRGRGSR